MIAHMPPGKEEMQQYIDRGLGGLVTNVPFKDYMKSPAGWQKLTEAVDLCEKLGAIVWIYDEQGYPSGGATKAVDTDADGRIELKLQPCQTVILVEMK